jgi:hypothetical protein
MKLLRTTALAAALMAIALPSLTSPAHAWRVGGWRGAGLGWRGAGLGWRGGGWGWRGAGVGLAAAAVAGSALAAGSYYGGYGYGYPAYGYGYGYPAYGYGYGTGYGYAANTYAPAYSYGYGTGYSYPTYSGYGGYHPIARRALYATAVGVRRRWH